MVLVFLCAGTSGVLYAAGAEVTSACIVAAIIVALTFMFWMWCCLRVASYESRKEEER